MTRLALGASIALAAVLAACGEGEEMSRQRPPSMPPKSWLFAHENSVMPGRSETLDDTGAFIGIPGKYGPTTRTTLININCDDSGDGMVVGVSAQLGKIVATAEVANTDVMLTAEWGNSGSPNTSIMKLGNGVIFSIPANFFRLTAQNLFRKTQVIASSAPYPLRGNDLSAPRWSFLLNVDASYLGLELDVLRLYDFYADPANFAIVPPSLRNTTPAPYIIPPYAQQVSLYVTSLLPGTYTVNQIDSGGLLTRTFSVVVGASGAFELLDWELAAETTKIRINSSIAPPSFIGHWTFDFKLGL